MLEHAEVAISEVNSISVSPLLSLTHEKFKYREEIFNDLKEYNVDLGENINRVLDNIIALLNDWGYKWPQVWEWIKEDTQKGDGYGVKQLRFSIYEVIVDAVLNHDENSILKYTEYLHNSPKNQILVPDELMDSHPELKSIGHNIC